MAKIYVGQDLRLTLTGGIGMTGGTALIQHKKPGSSTISGGTAMVTDYATATGYIDLVPADLDTAGTWSFWLRVVFADGKIGYGTPYLLKVYSLGT